MEFLEQFMWKTDHNSELHVYSNTGLTHVPIYMYLHFELNVAQFHNAYSNFGNLVSVETHNLAQHNGKSNLFSQN